MKPPWKEYLYFSRKERWAVAVFLLVIAVFAFLPRLLPPPAMPVADDVIACMPGIDSGKPIAYRQILVPASSRPSELFAFDPNTISEQKMLQLGLSPKIARTIRHYREKGGHFRSPEDIRKIYGLTPDLANRLIPLITITTVKQSIPKGSTGVTYSSSPISPTGHFDSSQAAPLYPRKNYAVTYVNTATQEDWKRFPGIGEVLSKRIVAFRTKMGHFGSVMDVKQTYGLPDTVFNRILPFLRLDSMK